MSLIAVKNRILVADHQGEAEGFRLYKRPMTDAGLGDEIVYATKPITARQVDQIEFALPLAYVGDVFRMSAYLGAEEAFSESLVIFDDGSTEPPPPPPPPPPPDPPVDDWGVKPPGNITIVDDAGTPRPDVPFPVVTPSVVQGLSDQLYAQEGANKVRSVTTTLNVKRGQVILLSYFQTSHGDLHYDATDDRESAYAIVRENLLGTISVGWAVSPKMKADGPVTIHMTAHSAKTFIVRTIVAEANQVIAATFADPAKVAQIGPPEFAFPAPGFYVALIATSTKVSQQTVPEISRLLKDDMASWWMDSSAEPRDVITAVERGDCAACAMIGATVMVV